MCAKYRFLTVSQGKAIRGPGEQRARQRFLIGQDIYYKCVAGGRVSVAGVGKILNVSSSGVRFTAQHTLGVGKGIEVTMEWPVLIENKCLLKLVIYGHVVRSDSNSAAVKIVRYEFRTRSSKAVPFLLERPTFPEKLS